ncbi:MAG: hypothetical protein ACUZ8H_06285 [Candidatus Anammoxibacter sp.]
MTILIILFIATCFLAYSNGGNDNFKGVATLFGSKTTNYKNAIHLATITTFAGSLSSIFFAQPLLWLRLIQTKTVSKCIKAICSV